MKPIKIVAISVFAFGLICALTQQANAQAADSPFQQAVKGFRL